jgi:nitric oxide reductase NorE protein
VQDGHTASVNDFYTYYFMFTGIHLGHVVLGMGALTAATRISRPGSTGTHRMAALEGIASFWHLVDLLWIMLFATLYLVR